MTRAAERLNRLPRVRLAHLPTPLEEAPRLSAYLRGPRLFVKRDDCKGARAGRQQDPQTGIRAGRRPAESDADCVVSGVSSSPMRRVRWPLPARSWESNVTSRSCTGVSRRRNPGMTPRATSCSTACSAPSFTTAPGPKTGVRLCSPSSRRCAPGGADHAQVPYGVSSPLGAMGYALMTTELLEQSTEMGIVPNYVVHASGSAGTQGAFSRC